MRSSRPICSVSTILATDTHIGARTIGFLVIAFAVTLLASWRQGRRNRCQFRGSCGDNVSMNQAISSLVWLNVRPMVV